MDTPRTAIRRPFYAGLHGATEYIKLPIFWEFQEHIVNHRSCWRAVCRYVPVLNCYVGIPGISSEIPNVGIGEKKGGGEKNLKSQ